MASLILIVPFLTVCVLIARLLLNSWRIRSNLPPGPPGWPLLGNIDIILSPRRHLHLMELGKKFGGIFTTGIGVQYSVWVTSYRLFREATVDNVWQFAGRPKEVAFGDLIPGIVASGVEEDDREIRRFTLVSLRTFGFGKSDMQNIILDEASTMIDQFRQNIDQPIDPRIILANASANVVAGVLLDKRFKPGDVGFHFVHEALTEGLKLVLVNAQYAAIPILKLFPNKKVKKFVDSFRNARDFLRDIAEEHEKTRVPGSPRDYIDVWLDQAEKGGENGRLFNSTKLESVLIDIFGGGFETTTTTLQWILIMMLHHPEVQAKVHDELDTVVGKGRQVTLDDRELLPYTEAVIFETLRIFPVIPFAVPHQCTEDAVLGGHKIPKDARVMLHLFSIHHDPDLWHDPEQFKPERFVVDGKLKLPEYLLPFGAGRRSCIGEQLARKELFLFFANLTHNLVFENPSNSDLPSLKLNDSVVMYPNPFELVAKKR